MTKLEYTPIPEIIRIHDDLERSFREGYSVNIEKRVETLKNLTYMLHENSDLIQSALEADLGKRRQEAYVTEIFSCINSAINAVHKVRGWAAPHSVSAKFPASFLGPQVRREPKGIALIISPWNYPLVLTIEPLVGAIASGSPVMIKTSELSENFSATISSLIHTYLDPKVVRVVNGAVPETTAVLKQKFGHILYTGNGTVGRIVQHAAAEHLTPTTLELGGKSPAVVADDANLDVIAKRLLWGKHTNAGQTCVSPDYVLCTPEMQDKLITAFEKVYKQFYPEGIRNSDSFGRIINSRHFGRLTGLLDKTKGDIVIGGDKDASDNFIALTIVKNVKADDVLMEGELFGPILPIVTVPSLDAAVEFIRNRDHPLALYVYTESDQVREKVFSGTLSGSAVQNEAIMQVSVTELPFGGVGESGHGSYHDKRTFDLFTYERSILRSKTWLEFLFTKRYPPYSESKLTFLRKAVRAPIDFEKPGQESVINALGRLTKKGVKLGALIGIVAFIAKKYGRN
ncbi:aldehyde dehydrogenase [Wallemia mellicola CBS 633.66]|uniref:Aldehyde dehydrogenase n=1 Tax=Wallemia mellicola (strain ATCC MYA-4683 / CBS 633.66) TaxID=671144 RepID=I4YB20_WALMC|nr:aldehyde dehydrogenase [Wallemia mellicola CBS 633.66]EIM21162.1 aldehyde dehydrogenase [Wallemia mellicola CBS 633.66]TIC00315.1 aldehyde dehydrogenase [Wallemia mellicola]|eukprot:XP_006958835.1 aldehyde dehydrogenase [Wallemia mellicola CBS 633.66]